MKEYKILFNRYRKSLFDFYENSFFTSIYRILGILIFPLFKKFSPNFISLLGLAVGIFALVLFFYFNTINLSLIISLFILSYILDYTDGIVARFQKKTSFHGRFMDGLFDILGGGCLHIILFLSLINNRSNTSDLVIFFCLISISLHPIQHLILDRYSALARWINERGRKPKLIPYYRNDFLGKQTKLLYDFQHFCIWAMLIDVFEKEIIIQIFFIFSFLSSTFSVGKHLYLSNKNFKLIKNQADNNEK